MPNSPTPSLVCANNNCGGIVGVVGPLLREEGIVLKILPGEGSVVCGEEDTFEGDGGPPMFWGEALLQGGGDWLEISKELSIEK